MHITNTAAGGGGGFRCTGLRRSNAHAPPSSTPTPQTRRVLRFVCPRSDPLPSPAATLYHAPATGDAAGASWFVPFSLFLLLFLLFLLLFVF